MTSITKRAKELFEELKQLPFDERVEEINSIRLALKKYSPFAREPVDCILWVRGEKVEANDYNPNSVAPPEMKLLELSIREDGFTQPIVTWLREDGSHEVVDGFHRNRVGKTCLGIRERLKNYLPVVAINRDRIELSDRMAATIRHNRARGKHSVDILSDIIVGLKQLNKSEQWIAKHFGMDPDEVLRLCQVSGLTLMFADEEFSKAWDIEYEYESSNDSYSKRKKTR